MSDTVNTEAKSTHPRTDEFWKCATLTLESVIGWRKLSASIEDELTAARRRLVYWEQRAYGSEEDYASALARIRGLEAKLEQAQANIEASEGRVAAAQAQMKQAKDCLADEKAMRAKNIWCCEQAEARAVELGKQLNAAQLALRRDADTIVDLMRVQLLREQEAKIDAHLAAGATVTRIHDEVVIEYPSACDCGGDTTG